MKDDIRDELCLLSDSKKAEVLRRFFKTDKGEYGYGDNFLGITIPQIRALVKKHAKDTVIDDIPDLLHNKYHEYRMAALLMLVYKYENGISLEEKQKIFDIYIENMDYINNWDLVDLSAPKIVGEHLLGRDCSLLYEFIETPLLWRQRVAVVSTLTFIRKGNFSHTIAIAEKLISTKEDLIQKSIGWMLREVGKRNKELLTTFLTKNRRNMPRTMLRYAIEKLSDEERRFFMEK
ncbi:MAG: DNA alkylation repair protein [Bacteroidales bacterium]